jgi:tetratricopeptide (TPR) repeat protein
LFLEQSDLEERERLRHQMIIFFHEGEINYQQNNLQKAQALFEEVINKGRVIRWQRLTNYAQNGLLEVLIKNGDFERAEKILSSGLFIATQSQEKRRIGHYQASYARLEKRRDNREEAKNWANKALKCFIKEGIKYDADEMRLLLQELDTDET